MDHKRNSNLLFLLTLIPLFVSVLPARVKAIETITVGTHILDLKGKAGETVSANITLKNNSTVARTTVFGFDTPKDPGDDGTHNDRSLTRWLQYNHAFPLEAKATSTTLDLAVSVFPHAKPGFYHALITLIPANSRSEAETQMRQTDNSVTINFEVLDDSYEAIELTSFRARDQFTSNPPVIFLSDIKNIGNRDLNVEGTLRVSDRKGQDMGNFPIKPVFIGQGQLATISTTWPGPGDMGKYKAYILLHYGREQKLVQDSTFFWVLNLKKIATLFVLGLSITLLLPYGLSLIRRKS